MRTIALAALALCASMSQSQAGTFPKPANAKPMFLTLPNHRMQAPAGAPVIPLAQWNGSFTDQLGQNVTYTMAGTDPSSTNVTTKVRVLIVPVKMVFGATNGNMTFDPLAVTLPNGKTLIDNVLASPLFSDGTKFKQGKVVVGYGQYIDAFQRANFWSSVSTNHNYHTVFQFAGVLPEMTVNVSKTQGMVITNPFGSNPAGEMYVNDFDTQVVNYIAANKRIRPGVLPLFISYDTYLTEVPLEVCCIGGYHSAISSQPNGQTYSYTTYEDEAGSFSQDVSAMSHELGEWMDDPFTDNSVNCTDNTIMEVGDPLENNPNYGGYPYLLNGFTYNLQSLVFIDYFGAPTSIPVNGWYSFQNDEPGRCPGQGGTARRTPAMLMR
ncbi:MAG: hypothetical protein JO261_12805 [Alphaproteobacteria bacterium]|nr:hypothetical protein [Alphaproteobacteria bacterium]MBV9694571.1 hypothetical protein [Alphaproteobacteria bacterium]